MSNAIQVAFQGATLFVVEHQQQPYVPMKHIVEGMGLAWQVQHRKMMDNPRWGVTEMVIPSNGGEQKASCIPLRKLPGWLSSIHPNKVKPELREKIIAFQNECDDILWAAWQEKTKQNLPLLPNLITTEQQGEIFNLIAERYPDGKHRAGAWSRFNNHFRLASYKNLPSAKFVEACEYINQMPVKAPSLPAPSLTNRQWLVSYDHNGKERVQPVSEGAILMTPEEYISALKEPNGLLISTELLMELAQIATSKLIQRCEYFKSVSKGMPVILNM